MKSLTFVEIDVPGFANPGQTVTYRFAEDTSYLPAEFDAIPSLRGVAFSPATISLGKDLGQRASITASFTDHKHVFAGEPYNQGSFWGKFRGRYGTKLRGRPFRLIRGLAGQPLAGMDIRHYIVETVDGPTPAGVYTIEAKDVLKLADNDRAQAPLCPMGGWRARSAPRKPRPSWRRRASATIVDDAGNVLNGAQVAVRREVAGAPLANLFEGP